MKGNRFTESQIIEILQEAESGLSIAGRGTLFRVFHWYAWHGRQFGEASTLISDRFRKPSRYPTQ